MAALVLNSCSGAKMSVADEQLARGEYFDAQKTYRKVYNKLNPREQRAQRAEVAAKMGECYRRLGQDARAAAAYQNALRYGYPDSSLLLCLASAQHGQGNYTQAIKSYEDYLRLYPNDNTARQGLLGARKGAELKRNKTRHVVRNAKLFNSRRADFSPMFNGETLYFTTTNEKVTGSNRSEITGMKRSDIWMVRKNERGDWQRPEAVEGELNTEWDEGIISFSPDGSTMYLTRSIRTPEKDTGVDIYTSRRTDAKWSAPVKLDITNDTLSSYGHPAVSPSGEYLYFTSDMPGHGGKDIWRINLNERAGSLENLGDAINTPGDEVFPYMLTDSIMYFSSDGHPGMGGLDIFRATLTPSGGWLVENMGSPINSEGDDFGITFANPGKEAGYFSSNRGDGRGYDHLYSFELPDLKIQISGWVLDRDEEPVPNAVIRIVGNDGSNQKAVAKNDGSFSFPLQRGVSYVMLAGAKGYLNAKQEFTSDTAEEDADYGIDFILASISKPNIVENIFYDFDKATLRPESKGALDSLVQMLRDNPNITIEMASHTDRWGSDEYNIRLSERRAKSVVDYLISAGIPAERLQYQGYGKSRPKKITRRLAREFPQFEEGQALDAAFIESLPEEEQEIADQINRRTEFQVLSVDYQMY
ncbi:OmpA family protein [Duncaniella sp.]|uniref:PorE family type IX secretion system protein n=1 Tax=Duncaniella sp. TaxID=2518496 RepID=UPI003422C17B